jgi:hypothetical protein
MRVALMVLLLAGSILSSGCSTQDMVDDAQRESQYGPPRNVSRSLLGDSPDTYSNVSSGRPGK